MMKMKVFFLKVDFVVEEEKMVLMVEMLDMMKKIVVDEEKVTEMELKTMD
jgi:hypothetical protein